MGGIGMRGSRDSKKSHDWDERDPQRCRNCGMLKTWPGARRGCPAFNVQAYTRSKRRDQEVEDAGGEIVGRSD